MAKEDFRGIDQDQADFMAGCALAYDLLQEASELDYTDRAELSSQYHEGAAQVDFVTLFLEQLFKNPELKSGFAAALSGSLVQGVACMDIHEIPELTYQQIFGPYQWPTDDVPVSNVLAFRRAHGEVSHG